MQDSIDIMKSSVAKSIPGTDSLSGPPESVRCGCIEGNRGEEENELVTK
jgi:hypothetical protein